MSKNRSKLLLTIGLMLALILAYTVGCAPSSQEATVQIAEATQVPEPTNVVVEVETVITVSTEPPPSPTNTPEPSPAPPSFELSANIAYVSDKNPKHTLDVYLPLDGEPP